MEAEAQREERGRKIVMSVRTLEDMAGKGVKYWRMEKIAVWDSLAYVNTRVNCLHTWNNQSLAAHDENYMHGAPGAQPKFLPLVKGEGKFADEDSAEPTDAD